MTGIFFTFLLYTFTALGVFFTLLVGHHTYWKLWVMYHTAQSAPLNPRDSLGYTLGLLSTMIRKLISRRRFFKFLTWMRIGVIDNYYKSKITKLQEKAELIRDSIDQLKKLEEMFQAHRADGRKTTPEVFNNFKGKIH